MKFSLPERFSEFSEARQNGFLRVRSVKESGGRIAGVFCTFTPLEILDAAGFLSVSLCGMSDETIPAAEVHLPKNLCPLIKSSYGFAVSDKCPYTYFSDLIVGETTCDGKKKMYELLGKLKPTHILRLPQDAGEDSADIWRAELGRFKAFLEDEYGVGISDSALRDAAVYRNRERMARLSLMQLQKLDPPPMWGLDLYKTLEGSGFIFEPETRLNRLTELHDEVEAGYALGKRTVGEDAKRILVTGCPIGGVLEKTVGLIEQNGGVVVCFENCTGIKAAYQQVDTEKTDILFEIADRYLKIGCAVFSPNDNRIENLKQLAEEYRIDGVIEIDLQACTPYCIESYEVRNTFKQLGVPYMAIETDYSKSDCGQLSTRIGAFLERI